MKTKTTTPDCVQMKRQAQAALLAEFQGRREQFATLVEFLAAKAKESPWVATVWGKFGGRKL